MSIRDNLENVQARIGLAARRSGRSAAEVRLLGVTKFAADQQVLELFEAGVTAFGESRIQQARRRIEQFPEPDWHFIGSLQTNKARYCRGFALIHSLDRLSLAQVLNREAAKWGKIQDVLIQVNASGEASKSGLAPAEVDAFAKTVLSRYKNLNIRGLMTMAPLIPAAETRPFFRETKALYDLVQQELGVVWDSLSMGMTNDFEIAIEEGATLVRIGSALFAKGD